MIQSIFYSAKSLQLSQAFAKLERFVQECQKAIAIFRIKKIKKLREKLKRNLSDSRC